jgi:putative transposase
MARLPRLTVPGLPHHVIQRGNNRQEVFRDAADCQRFLALLAELAPATNVALHAFVLMPNHVHLLVTPAESGSLSRLMQALGRRYAAWFNKRHARTGSLWEGRFRASVIESERYLFACSRYIEMNPVRAGLVSDPAEYRWSSFAHHVGLRPDAMIREHALVWSLGNTPYERQAAYRRLFEQPASAAETERIRIAIQGGWAVGAEGFASAVAEKAHRRALPRKAGRPHKPLNQSVPE